jgi:hypothetical protein
LPPGRRRAFRPRRAVPLLERPQHRGPAGRGSRCRRLLRRARLVGEGARRSRRWLGCLPRAGGCGSRAPGAACCRGSSRGS